MQEEGVKGSTGRERRAEGSVNDTKKNPEMVAMERFWKNSCAR